MRKVRLAGELRSAIEARRLVEDELGLAGADDDTMLHAQLVVTELVTNAARHAQTPVELKIATAVGRVRIEARDGSAATLTPHGDTPTRHRGLQLIEDLSDGWGVEAQHAGGKVIWCELPSRGIARQT
ncbi:MAG: ATP-binding protein [Actinobacteria bacterium]|nr:ATP-binding protein [Actinomycetota bacterium]